MGFVFLTRGYRLSGAWPPALVFADDALRLPVRVTLRDGVSLVVQAASPRERELDLGETVLEVDAERHESESLLGDATGQLVDLLAVQQQFARPDGIETSISGRVFIRSQMGPQEPQFAVFDPGVSVLQRHLSQSKRLDLGPFQGDAALIDLEDVVVVPSAPVARDVAEHRLAGIGWRPGLTRAALSRGGFPRGHRAKRYRAGLMSDSEPPLSQAPGPSAPGPLAQGTTGLRLTRSHVDEMVWHCLSVYPEEGCGLLTGDPVSGTVTSVHPTTNRAASARLYTVDPREHLLIERAAEAIGNAVIGVFHSHTTTDAYPSPTDVAQAPDPSWHYVVVSLRQQATAIRCYRIVESAVTEEAIEASDT